MVDVQISKFKVTGMHCSSCSTAVQKALSVTPGVERASVSLTLEQAEVVYDPGLAKEVSRHLAWLSTCVRQPFFKAAFTDTALWHFWSSSTHSCI